MAERGIRLDTVRAFVRIGAIAAGWGVLSYVLVDWARPDDGFVSVSFAIVQPAAICAFIACLADPTFRRGIRFYLMVPFWSAVGMIAVAAFVLREGVICIAMLAPLWILFGLVGAGMAYRIRSHFRPPDDNSEVFRAYGLLVLPLVIMPIEASLPVPQAQYTVTREVVIEAPADTIWPMMRGIGTVGPAEGRWNVSQSLLGMPRPQSAVLIGDGPGATRIAQWQRGVVFREVVDDWRPANRIGWQFDFTGSRGWDMTDPHLRPDGPYFRIESGGYTLVPLDGKRHLLRLETHYTAQTHFNGYAAMWGELVLGDIQDNVLAIIRQRAETVTARNVTPG